MPKISKLSDISNSAAHWSPEQMLDEALSFSREHPEYSQAYVILAKVEEGEVFLQKLNSGLSVLEVNGLLSVAKND